MLRSWVCFHGEGTWERVVGAEWEPSNAFNGVELRPTAPSGFVSCGDSVFAGRGVVLASFTPKRSLVRSAVVRSGVPGRSGRTVGGALPAAAARKRLLRAGG